VTDSEAQSARLVPLFRQELECCDVRPGQSVGILTMNGTRSDYAIAFEAAASSLGAEAFIIDVASSGQAGIADASLPALANKPMVVAALGQCDIVIDLLHMLWSREQHTIQGAGARVLLCHELPSALVRLFPTPDQRRRVELSAEMLGAARSMRMTSAAGTDVTFDIGQYGLLVQHGSTDSPGRWDHFPSSLVATIANDAGASGTIVLNTRDVLLPLNRYIGRPVTLRVENARVVGIDGGEDAELLTRYIESFNDERGYELSHVGWGLNERAMWESLGLGLSRVGMDNRSMLGSVMFSLGPNTELGGKNDTACHIDIPTRGCSLELDGELLIDSGQMVHKDLVPGQPVTETLQ
jgi:2,5-dihydroxypyridine 5,6-dioxygenase